MRRLRFVHRCSINQPCNGIRSLSFFRLCWALASFAIASAGAYAQDHEHVDAEFEYVDGRVQFHQSVYTHVFPKSGISRQYTTNPGFGSETDIGLGIDPNDTVFYHVLDRLFFWDGANFAEPAAETQIRIQNNPTSLPDTIVGAQTVPQEGALEPPRNRIGSAMSNGDFHSRSELPAGTAAGRSAATARVRGVWDQVERGHECHRNRNVRTDLLGV